MITDERRNELLEIKQRLQGLLVDFAGNEMLVAMVTSMIAGIDDELA